MPRPGKCVTWLLIGFLGASAAILQAGAREDAQAQTPPVEEAGTWETTRVPDFLVTPKAAFLLPSGKVMALGDTGRSSDVEWPVQHYDPHFGVWTTATWSYPAQTYSYAAFPLAMIEGKSDQCGVVCGHLLVHTPSPDLWEIYDPNPDGGRRGPAGSTILSRVDGASATSLTGPECYGEAAPSYCGKLLIVGGYNGPMMNEVNDNASRKSAELYDPITRTFSLIEGLQHNRRDHLAVGLGGGKVLVVSEAGIPGEIYTPGQGWSTTDSAALPGFDRHWRYSSATPLPGGEQILIAGTPFGSGSPDNAEIYDVQTRRFSSVSGCNCATVDTATLLENGKVLLTTVTGNVVESKVFDPEAVGDPWLPIRATEEDFGRGTAAVLLKGTQQQCSDNCGKVLLAAGRPVTDKLAYLFTPAFDPITVTGMTNGRGPATGGTQVEITGTGFTGETTVTFGDVAARKVTVESETQLSAVSPEHDPGPVTVNVSVPATGRSADAPSQFTFHPAITRLDPSRGATAGGEAVTVRGKGLIGVTQVRFEGPSGARAAAQGSRSDNALTVTTPGREEPEVVRVVLSAGGLESMTAVESPNADLFTYVAPGPVLGSGPDGSDGEAGGDSSERRITNTPPEGVRAAPPDTGGSSLGTQPGAGKVPPPPPSQGTIPSLETSTGVSESIVADPVSSLQSDSSPSQQSSIGSILAPNPGAISAPNVSVAGVPHPTLDEGVQRAPEFAMVAYEGDAMLSGILAGAAALLGALACFLVSQSAPGAGPERSLRAGRPCPKGAY